MPYQTAVAVLCIPVAGVVAQWLAWRLRLPAIVLLFVVGLLFGPGLQILHPTHAFGGALRPLVGLAVAIVVFEGGLALDFRELRAAGEGVLRLTAVALPISFAFGAVAAHFVAGLGWGPALLFGAITVVTGPTVVLPLLRHTRLERRAASLLKWEAIANDPVGAILAAIVLSVLVADGGTTHVTIAMELALGLVGSLALGIGAGFLVHWMFTRDQVPEVLKTPMLLALALGTYAVSNLVLDEAGLAAATIFGVTLANLRIPGITELARFKEALTVLIVSALFVVLTASLERDVLAQLSWPLVLLTLAMLIVVRPAAILVATAWSNLSWQERTLAAWIAPRGVVAAAVAGAASTRLANGGFPDGGLVMPAVFALIAATMILHGFTLAPLARRLKLTLGDAPGVAIVGASAWTTDMAGALARGGIPTLLIDTFPGALDAARAACLPVLQAEVLSEHGGESLADQRVDYLLAATQDDAYNSLVCIRLAPELGRHRAFQLGPSGRNLDGRTGLSREWRGQVLGDPPLGYAAIRRRHRQGWQFRLIAVADDKATPAAGSQAVPLMTVRMGGALVLASAEGMAAAPVAGDRVLVLAPPDGAP